MLAVLAGGRAHSHGPAGSSAPPREVSRCLDLGLRLERSTDGRAASGVRLVTSYDGGEHLDLLLDPATGDLVVDRGAASPDDRAKRGAWRIPLGVPAGAAVEVRAIMDHSVIEVFTGTGEVLTMRFYPVADTPWRLVAFAAGVGEAGLAVRTWDLAPLVIRETDVEQWVYG